MCNDNDLKDKITIKEIHETYWRCRDFELSHLWQRSIFLSAFLVLCFTGYGALLINILGSKEDITFLNVLAFSISVIGIIFSCLWIMMGKGSKAWYERYERAIEAFEKNLKYVTPKAAHIGGFQYGNIQDYKYPELHKNIFKGEGGAFSPSKINIAIGQITMIIWIIAFLFHSSIIIWNKKIVLCDYLKYIVLGLGIISLLVFFLFVFIHKIHWLHSPTLNNE